MLIYICDDLGCVFRLHKGELECAPQYEDDTFDTKEFGVIDIPDTDSPECERVIFKGQELPVTKVDRAIKKMLELKQMGVRLK